MGVNDDYYLVKAWPSNYKLLWPNFSLREMKCKCGCGKLPNTRFMLQLQKVRNQLKRKMVVTSGARCPEYNAKVSSSGLTGPHTKGAADIAASGALAHRLVLAAMELGATGIGVHQKGAYKKRFVHIDFLEEDDGLPRPTIWTY